MKRIDKLKILNSILNNIHKELSLLYKLIKQERNKEVKSILNEFLLYYATLNRNFNLYLITKVKDFVKKDEIDIEFDDLMKKAFKHKEKNDKDNNKPK